MGFKKKGQVFIFCRKCGKASKGESAPFDDRFFRCICARCAGLVTVVAKRFVPESDGPIIRILPAPWMSGAEFDRQWEMMDKKDKENKMAAIAKKEKALAGLKAAREQKKLDRIVVNGPAKKIVRKFGEPVPAKSASAPAKKQESKKKEGGKRQQLFGQSVCAVFRALGVAGMTPKQVIAAMAKMGIKAHPGTISVHVYNPKERYGKPAKLSRDQIAQVKKAAGNA